MRAILGAFLILVTAGGAHATGLVIHAAEVGVGKFHRYDNSQHVYPATNVWKNYILPGGAIATPVITENADGSVSLFFSTLEELFRSTVAIAKSHGQKISVLNVNAHGMPGSMWFPKDKADARGFACASWQEAAQAKDSDNYDQYYSPISKDEILQFRQLAEISVPFGCTAGLAEWSELNGRVPEFKLALAKDAQIHFLSCLVGLGSVGQSFTRGVAALLLDSPAGRIETSLDFGLGDWSMNEGLGFWNFQNDDQLRLDNQIYPVNRRDRDLQQKGSIRIATNDALTGVHSGILSQIEYMYLGTDERPATQIDIDATIRPAWSHIPLPEQMRVPNSRAYVHRLNR